MALRVTAKWLEKMRACKEQVELFKKVFPRGAAVTRENYRKAKRAGLDMEWLASYPSIPLYAMNAADKADHKWGSVDDIMVLFGAMKKRGRKHL